MSKSATKMTEVIISVDSKGGYASISRMQSVATKKCIRKSYESSQKSFSRVDYWLAS